MTSSITLLLLLMSSFYMLATANWTLTVLHTNDVHASYMPTDASGAPCLSHRRRRRDVQDAAASGCYGGQARLKSAVREAREANPGRTLLLDAGDQFTGTALFFLYGPAVVRHMMTWQGYDAMALGNHEFDRGLPALTSFLRSVSFPVLSTNVNASLEPDMAGLVRKSAVFNLDGHRVGVVGYTSVDTPEMSKTGRIQFESVLASVRSEVERLTEEGVNIIIALGHAGFSVDQQVAVIAGVDLVVGGHSHTYLYTGAPPSAETPEGVYPYPVPRQDGSAGLVVQAFTRAKYLGVLHLTFNDRGDVIGYGGNPRLLNSSVAEDGATVDEMALYVEGLQGITSTNIARSLVTLQGDRNVCRQTECNLGNVVADSMVKQTLSHFKAQEWSDVAIGLVNGGGLRDTIERGDISMESVMNVLPFRNTLVALAVTGGTLREVFEHSVSLLEPCSATDLSGRFLQVSGVRVSYDLRKPVGQRVRTLDVLCLDTSDYCPLDNSAVYKIVVPFFLANGGDGYTKLRDNALASYDLGYMDTSLLTEYLQRISPCIQTKEGRIQFYMGSNLCDHSQPVKVK